MKTNQLNFSTLVAVLLFFTTTPSTAVTLSLVTGMTTVNPGDPLSIDIVVSELGAGNSPSIGAFDLDITYDDTVLMATGVDLGLLLGNQNLFEANAGFDLSTSGVVDLFEVSFFSPSELDALQPSSFILGSLNFKASGLGISSLDFTQVILSDSFGQLLNPAIQGASVNVVPTSISAIPIPPTLWLFGAGLISLIGFSNHKTQ
jgi:hypothetical protein